MYAFLSQQFIFKLGDSTKIAALLIMPPFVEIATPQKIAYDVQV
jgi:hypothetical protein